VLVLKIGVVSTVRPEGGPISTVVMSLVHLSSQLRESCSLQDALLFIQKSKWYFIPFCQSETQATQSSSMMKYFRKAET
jgi:hypothetical protein